MKRILTLVILLSFSLGLRAETPADVVVDSPTVSVTQDELGRYMVVQANQTQEDGELPQLDTATVRRMAENLFMLHALAQEAEAAPGFDQEQARWQADIMYKRSIIDRYRNDYVANVLRDVNWEATAKEAYLTQQDAYMTKETVRVSHILVKIKPVRTQEEALKIATDLRERAVNGEDFAKLAKQNSEDPSASRNSGDMGFFERGRMVKPFEDAAFAMTEEGSISEPILSPFGYHVIQYHGRKAPEQVPFEKVKDRIVTELKEQMGTKVWRDKLIAMRSVDGIKYNDELIEELSSEFQAPAKPE